MGGVRHGWRQTTGRRTKRPCGGEGATPSPSALAPAPVPGDEGEPDNASVPINDMERGAPSAWKLWARPMTPWKGSMTSILNSRSDTQSSTVAQLHADARRDYQQHNSAENQAAAREQSGQARTHGNASGGSWGHRH